VIVVPAIDLRQGRVVRLHQGRAQEETVYAVDPAEVGASRPRVPSGSTSWISTPR
jgi:phosphoribosylformimino-5-aminoimidazole carboxamide ribonucleotide (ProFAR) isomerase